VPNKINGDPALVAIERAINELRCGRAIYCYETDDVDALKPGVLLVAAETASIALIARLEQLAGESGVALAITAERADALGLRSPNMQPGKERHPLLLRLHPPVSTSIVHRLAGVKLEPAAQRVDYSQPAVALHPGFSVEVCDALTASALKLAKHARLLPAVLVIASPPPSKEVLEISAAQLERLSQPGAFDLERVSEARVPLAGHEDCRLVVFRDGRDASEHVAVVIGKPQSTAVPVRLHSACLTGDLLGSLRCDCGDQLRSAVDQLAAVGGGVLLYLAQEGRGIGLANKLRAYELQDAGLDTLEADRHLGFSADERSYAVAASILRHLGMTRIRLLTNNLDKIQALQMEGIDVVAGQRVLGPVNRHNARYIHAKRERAGHLVPAIDMDELS
jgi:GTP cyclohydrolase II